MITISKQLNAAPYLRDVHKPCPLLREETMSAVRLAAGQLNDHGHWSENGTTCAHAYKTLKWCPTQRSAATVL